VLIASLNPGKARELSRLALHWGLSPVAASEVSLEAPEESGTSFLENAELKARAAASHCEMPALADDSGLIIEAQPRIAGVHTARWAQALGGYDAAFARLLGAEATEAQCAIYVCALCYALPDGEVWLGEGRVTGCVVYPARCAGPGVWPYFVPAGADRSLAELDEAELERAHPRWRAGAALRDPRRPF